MINRSHVIIALIALAVGIVATLLWKHDADARRDGRIAVLDSLRRQDSIARVTAERKTDSTTKLLAVASVASAKVDTLWRTTTKNVTNTVNSIVHDTVLTAAEKVPLLVAQVTRLQTVGDSVANVNTTLRGRIVADSSAHTAEREASNKELRTATDEIALLKKQSRHWGLGAGLGYGATRVKMPDGTAQVRTGPALMLGVVYRW